MLTWDLEVSATDGTALADRVHCFRGTPLGRRIVTPTSVPEGLWLNARVRPDRVFVTTFERGCATEALTYAELADATLRVAHYLRQECGIRPGRRIALRMRNDVDSVVSILAVLAAGATAVLVSPSDPVERVREQFDAAGCEFELVAGEPADSALPIVELARARRGVGVPRSAAGLPPPDPDAAALIVFTTGTTAAAKAVVQTHYGIAVNCAATVIHHRLTQRSRLLCCLPLHHVNGLEFTIFSTMLAGAGVLLCTRFEPKTFLRVAAEAAPDIASVVPSILAAITEAPHPPALPRLRYFVSAAAPLSRSTARRVHESFGTRIVQGYGLSETMNFSTTMPVDLDEPAYRRWVLDKEIPPVGHELFGTEVAVLTDVGEPAEAGELGEVCMRGHSIMAGYLDNPAATREAFAGGWFHSGDIGYWEAEPITGRSFITLTGRRKNIIKVGGESVSLDELDRLLLEVEGVRDAACFATADEILGEAAVAVVAASADVTAEAIVNALARRVATVHLPREIVFAADLPRTPNGKVNRLLLQQLFEAPRT